MGLINSDKSWKAYGKKNAYYGVLTHKEYLDKNLSQENKQKFFQTGEKYVDHLFDVISKKIDHSFNPKTTLDFGCGTGRLALEFCKKGIKTVGMDVSEDMLKEAEINAKDQGIENVSFEISDDNLLKLKDSKFDLINSYIVFQHINTKRGISIFSKLIDHLNEKGIGVVQFTYQSNKPKIVNIANYFRYRVSLVNSIMNVIKGKSWSEPLMQMNAYSLNTIFSILQRKGITKSYQELEEHGDFWGITVYFQK